MTNKDLILFEFKRSAQSIFNAVGLASVLFGAILVSALVLYGLGPVREVSTRDILFILGAAWSSMAAVYAIDRNRGSTVEDVWFALDPRWRGQLIGLYLAWLPVALLQALATSLLILLVRPDSQMSDLAGLALGFSMGLPLGLLLCPLARLVPGFSLLAGVVFLGVIFSARALPALLPALSPGTLAVPIIGYLAAAILGFAVLTRMTGRAR
jgi:hypothetical protein